MKVSILAAVMTASFMAGGFAHAARPCKRAAVQVARTASPQFKTVFDLNSIEETPDLVTYEVTLADVMPDPTATETIEVVLNKATCSLISDPVKK
jgi:hypothetical protein